MDTQKLVKECIREIPAAQRQLYEHFAETMLGVCYRYTKSMDDAEDVLQDVFYKLVEANRLLMPIDHVTGWLFQVARNRITDLFRKKSPDRFSEMDAVSEEGERLAFEDLLPSNDAGPQEEYLRGVLLDELEAAVAELPREQREVFVAHELEGRSFREMAVASGVKAGDRIVVDGAMLLRTQ